MDKMLTIVSLLLIVSIAAETSGDTTEEKKLPTKRSYWNYWNYYPNYWWYQQEVNRLRSTVNYIYRSLETNRARDYQLQREYWLIRSTQDRFKSTLETAKNAYFIVSDPFQGKRYLLSREATFYYTSFGQSLCTLAGGYLAEINTWDEFHFVRNFLYSKGSKFTDVMAGGSDEGHEGRWINRHSGTYVSSFWAAGKPNNLRGIEHCQVFSRQYNWYMDDRECSFTSSKDIGFVCEVPQ